MRSATCAGGWLGFLVAAVTPAAGPRWNLNGSTRDRSPRAPLVRPASTESTAVQMRQIMRTLALSRRPRFAKVAAVTGSAQDQVRR
jgi:predicted DNA-binding transcriptional regulator